MISPFPMLVSLAPSYLRWVGSPTRSLSPLVHGFPRPAGAAQRPSLPSRVISVVRVLSSTRLPGFIGPESSATIRGSATPCPLPVDGIAVRSSVFYGLKRPQVQRASRGKTHDLPVYRPTSVHFGCCGSDIGTRAAVSARPPPHTHIVGSLFATYTGSASCFLQTAPWGRALALLAFPFRPITAGFRDISGLPVSARVPCPAHTC